MSGEHDKGVVFLMNTFQIKCLIILQRCNHLPGEICFHFASVGSRYGLMMSTPASVSLVKDDGDVYQSVLPPSLSGG